MRIKPAGIGAAFCLALMTLMGPLHAADHARVAPGVTWVHPVIAKFGGVHPRPDAAVQPDPHAVYKIFVDVTSGAKDPDTMIGSLQRVARLVNLMGYAKVPPAHVHIVALLDGNAVRAALTDAAYNRLLANAHEEGAGKRHGNPNLPIVHALHAAGVKLMICSQAMAGLGLKDSDIDPSVTVTLSALTDTVIYEHDGFTYMRL